MKIVLFCDPQPNQKALAGKIAGNFNLAGIVIEKRTNKKGKISVKNIFEKILNVSLFSPIRSAWINLQQSYQKKFPQFPNTLSIIVDNINSQATINFAEKIKPELIIVSGTSILKKEILQLNPPKGIINLHTGLSPYIKGAPNCTNWCIAENKFYLIGNTIMWIDKGIDSGDIITTEITQLNGNEDLLQLHIKVMEHAHSLLIKTLKKIETDYEHCPRVKQSSIADGITYYNRQWNWKAKAQLLKNIKNLKDFVNSGMYKQRSTETKTVGL